MEREHDEEGDCTMQDPHTQEHRQRPWTKEQTRPPLPEVPDNGAVMDGDAEMSTIMTAGAGTTAKPAVREEGKGWPRRDAEDDATGNTAILTGAKAGAGEGGGGGGENVADDEIRNTEDRDPTMPNTVGADGNDNRNEGEGGGGAAGGGQRTRPRERRRRGGKKRNEEI